MLKFRYKPSEDMVRLMFGTIEGFHDEYITGIMEDELALQLRKMKCYLVCAEDESKTGMRYYNPMAIVAKSDYDAVGTFYRHTDLNGSVMCVLENNAAKMKVEAY